MKEKKIYTPENITSLPLNHIFCFGSNTEGRHGAGAAKVARENFGAKYGQARGFQGQSYAIVTKDLKVGMRSVSLDSIFNEVVDLMIFAENFPKYTFWVTKIGSSLAGFEISEIKSIFEEIYQKASIPENINLPFEYEVREERL